MMSQTLISPKIDKNSQITAKEIYIIPIENTAYLIYLPLQRLAFLTDPQTAQRLETVKTGETNIADLAISQTIPALLKLNDKHPLENTKTGHPLPTALTLFLTTACQLRCSYCYASAGDTATEMMPLATAKRGIDYIINNIEKKNFIATNCQQPPLSRFYLAYHGGGEPTINWQVLQDSYTYAKQQTDLKALTLYATLASNGVLKDAQIDWIAQHINHIGISFGGLPNLHDKHRFMANGTGSSDRVMHTLARFDTLQVNYTLRLTLTADQLPYLPDTIQFICERYHPTKIQLELIHNTGRGANQNIIVASSFLTAYQQAQAVARRYGHTLHYATADLQKLTTHYCGISQDTFALSPQGNVSACYASFSEKESLAPVFFYGKPETTGKGYLFDLNKLNQLRQQSVIHKPDCQNCYAKWHCAGDCYHEALTTHSTVASPSRCQITRALVKEQLIENINLNADKYWQATEM
ncbi:radical SAM additional 4Fe4S-binding domain protein [Beggiatoa alba B18LD]|uniref:Radical SAM additional 4Fe4S-binding domain protein n=1 Tax=Beggiatoa alba B18LD TaxID=395493 RepID=I3CBR3_9GAMM|nr:radical SAM protein [Beggiatoa alba]EIJ41056.1 radical SAM additional 4Fe4S-binding domain protein [Beggiatoa alba B18LD]